MRAPHPLALGLILLAAAAWRADGQGLRVAVAINTPPVAARIVIGEPMYSTYHYRPAGVWITDPYLARLHRRHMVWVSHEQARLQAGYRHDHRYWKAVRAFQRERARRERELDRAYDRWLRDQERGHRKGHRH